VASIVQSILLNKLAVHC